MKFAFSVKLQVLDNTHTSNHREIKKLNLDGRIFNEFYIIKRKTKYKTWILNDKLKLVNFTTRSEIHYTSWNPLHSENH